MYATYRIENKIPPKKKRGNISSGRQVPFQFTYVIVFQITPMEEQFHHIQIIETRDCLCNTDWPPLCVISYSVGLKVKQLLGLFPLVLHIFYHNSIKN